VLAFLLELNAVRAKEEALSGVVATKKRGGNPAAERIPRNQKQEISSHDHTRRWYCAANSLEVRARLVEALKLDLVGPRVGHAICEERLPGWCGPQIGT